MLFSANDTISNVRILKYVGAGAFGEVYHAIDLAMNRECAVKYVENTDPAAFKAHIEAQVLHLCKHDRVVEVFDVQPITHAGKKYAAIEMEYLPDGSAEAFLEKQHVSLRMAIRWVIDILFALENSHNNSVLHRDIKPANFMLKGKYAKLSDFGLAKATGGVPHGSAAGTPIYSAPELFSAKVTSVATEIFSTGMSLYQLACNMRDWGAFPISKSMVEKGQVVKRIGYPGYIPERLKRVCNKACNHDPAKRFKSAHEMRQALESLSIRLEWIQTQPNDWIAEDGTKEHRLTIAPGKNSFEVIYQVNGRRKNESCAKFSTMSEAIAGLSQKVSQSSLR
ncbi:serine/threonine-protein kinase [Mesorhizobium sp. LSJC269B00]|uniref:serine/threonine-protein kinase n=1 Tax=Mesorhizobium sp. LSJC269B00 TaxID=1287326 RepID=UPI000A040765|nr:serine/threonine-protein kinase [Mesorhizobium sp. LSJC269B00]